MKIVFLESLGLSVERIEDECKTLEALGHEVVIYTDVQKRMQNVLLMPTSLSRAICRCTKISSMLVQI